MLDAAQESAILITTVLDWINTNPELTSILVIGLAVFGLAPAIITAVGATALVYALLSVRVSSRSGGGAGGCCGGSDMHKIYEESRAVPCCGCVYVCVTCSTR